MKNVLLVILAILGWGTLLVRLYLRISESNFTPLESTIQFFSYFTILTNLLVTVFCTRQLISSNDNSTIQRPESLTALTVYILIVGSVYHVALKPIWNPDGLQMILSEIHHTVVPLGTLLLWIYWPNKGLIELKRLLMWLIYPFLYILIVLIRGNYSTFYPYPFLNVNELGLASVIKNSLFLLGVMVILLLLFYGIGRKWKHNPIVKSD